jgi:serine/threonine protein kinase/tetratricopeptide (TPR) repeat protein
VDPLLWKRIGELFAAARQLNGESRLAFLKENCGQDQQLFEQVVSLLEIDTQPGPLDSTATISALPVPQVIAGRFRIIRYIAEGGMGTVYEAEDLTLHDRVALKTIRPDIASHPRAVERFKHEIVLGKKVTHPNVCRIHDLGVDRSENGTEFLFLTMQFLSGETLASRIRRGPIPATESLPLIEDMADALSAAHQVEVIHRDFKSGNVMLVTGPNRTCAVVTDFGLARGIHEDSSRTHAGMVGTVDYMAPEQIRGECLTPAVDIYALGVVMYEMTTGQRPFTGDSKVTVALKHLNDHPRPPQDLAPHLEPNWNETILGCLRKPPLERFQSAAEVKEALVQNGAKSRRRLLRRPSGRTDRRLRLLLWLGFGLASLLLVAATVLVVRHNRLPSASQDLSIAVLPFAEETAGPENQYFGEELSNEIIAALSRVPALSVIARNSSFSISDSNLDLKVAAQQLHTRYLVTGSVRFVDNRVQIAAQLIDPPNNRILWSQTFQRDRTQTAALHAEIVRGIISRLGVQASGAQLAVFGLEVPPEAAVALYMRGRTLWASRSPKNLSEALKLFTQCIVLDPTFAAAYAARADTLAIMAERSYLAAATAVPQAKEAALHALILDPQLPEAHAALGLVQDTGEWDFYNAEKSFQRAIQLGPSYVYSHQWYAAVLLKIGKGDEAIREAETAARLDPLSPAAIASVGWMNYYTYKYDVTLQIADDLSKKYPYYPDVCMLRADTMIAKHAFAGALRALATCTSDIKGTPLYLRSLAVAQGLSGDTVGAMSTLTSMLAMRENRPVSEFNLSAVYASLNRPDEAFYWLNQGIIHHDSLTAMVAISPFFEPIRTDSRYPETLARIGLPYKK